MALEGEIKFWNEPEQWWQLPFVQIFQVGDILELIQKVDVGSMFR